MERIMKKFLGLTVLVALACTTVLAVKAAPNEKKPGNPANLSEAQLSQLDKRLADRIAEQQELMTMVERMLNMNFQGKANERAKSANVLSGGARPAAAPILVKGAAKPPPPPWWQSFRPQMTYLSGNDRSAVINGKMVVSGQNLGDGVVVESIDDAAVSLRRAKELHTYQLKK
jgi:hypothetical protein